MEATAAGGHAQGDVLISIEGVYGSEFADVLHGDENANNLQGHDGDDELYGNADPLPEGEREGNVDVFVFETGHGNDTIHDFVDSEDKIDLSAFDLSGFDDLSLSSDDGGTTIDLSAHGGGTILLFEFDIANLDATDFLF